MAVVNTLLPAHVTIVSSWSEGGANGRRYRVIEATFGAGSGDSLTMGGATNKILASAFGLTKIVECSNGVLDDNSKAYNLSPSADGTFLVNQLVTHATDANKTDIGDWGVTIANPRRMRVVLKGY